MKRENYQKLRTNPENFLDKPVRKPNLEGELQPGTIKSGGKEHGFYTPEAVNSNAEMVRERKKGFETPPEIKELSEDMELMFTDLIHLIFPSFQVNIPAEVDDLFNGTDLTLFKRKGDRVSSVFSFDLFFQNTAGEDVYWKRKLFKNMQKLLKGNFSYINYLHSPEILLKNSDEIMGKIQDELFFSAQECPVFLLPISRESLDRLRSEYSEGGPEVEILTQLRKELRYCVFLQIQVFKMLIVNLADKAKREKLEKIVGEIEKNLGNISSVPESYNDETVKDICVYLERILGNNKSFLKSLGFHHDTDRLKRGERELGEYSKMSKVERNKLGYGEQKRIKRNKKTKGVWVNIKKIFGY